MKLWLVRHAQPLLAADICYGRLDVPADPLATRLCAEALAQQLPHGIRVKHSPLQRCEQLSKHMKGLRPDLICEPDENLAEMDFGQWEGQRWDVIGQPAIDAWVAHFGDHRPGGGESANGVLHRVGIALQATAAHRQHDGRDAVWLTHAGVIRAARLWAAGTHRLRHASDWPADTPAFGSWQCIHLAAGTTIAP